MSKIMKNFLTTVAMSFFAINVANAIPRAPCDPPPSDACCEKPKPGPFGFYYPYDNYLVCGRNFYVAGEFLAMQVKQDGLNYAMTNNNGGQNANNVSSGPLSGGQVQGFSTQSDDWSFGYGLRFNMGFLSNHDKWNLDLSYTYLHFEQDESSTISGNGRMLPFWLVPQSFPTIASNTIEPEQEASAQLKIHYNTLDLSLGKPYHVSRCFAVNPYFGFRAAWIDECYLARYGGSFLGDLEATTPEVINGVDAEADNDLWGFGLRTGIMTEWKLGRGFFLYGSAAAALLRTKFDVDQSVAEDDRSYTISHYFKQNIPNAEIALGFGWSCLFNCQRNRVTIRALYEHHHWWNVNQLRRFYDVTIWSANDTVARGDLQLNGVSVRLAFDF